MRRELYVREEKYCWRCNILRMHVLSRGDRDVKFGYEYLEYRRIVIGG